MPRVKRCNRPEPTPPRVSSCLTYSVSAKNGLSRAEIGIDRKVPSDIAIFVRMPLQIVDQVKVAGGVSRRPSQKSARPFLFVV
jgi:hypothetical protein